MLPVGVVVLVAALASTLWTWDAWWIIELLLSVLWLVLIADAARRLASSLRLSSTHTSYYPPPANSPPAGHITPRDPLPVDKSEKRDEEEDLVLIVAEEASLIALDADYRFDGHLSRTPIPQTRVLAREMEPLARSQVPNMLVTGWSRDLNSIILDKVATALALSKEKVADAMSADASKMAAELENKELKKKLQEALSANIKYEKLLQDLRHSPAKKVKDYKKMTPQQRAEEERILREELARLEESAKSPALPKVSIPSYFGNPEKIG